MLVGHGRVGTQVLRSLLATGRPVVVAEQLREVVEALRAQGQVAVLGDASDPAVLVQAHVAHAALLIVAGGDSLQARRMVRPRAR